MKRAHHIDLHAYLCKLLDNDRVLKRPHHIAPLRPRADQIPPHSLQQLLVRRVRTGVLPRTCRVSPGAATRSRDVRPPCSPSWWRLAARAAHAGGVWLDNFRSFQSLRDVSARGGVGRAVSRVALGAGLPPRFSRAAPRLSPVLDVALVLLPRVRLETPGRTRGAAPVVLASTRQHR